jgi:hypothetical protein
MALGGLAGTAGNRSGAAEACEGGRAAEATDIAGVGDNGGGDGGAGSGEIGDGVAVLVEQLREFGVERGDAAVELFDLARQFADAARRCFGGEAVSEGDPLEPSQGLLAMCVDDLGFRFGVDLRPNRAQSLDGLGAVGD